MMTKHCLHTDCLWFLKKTFHHLDEMNHNEYSKPQNMNQMQIACLQSLSYHVKINKFFTRQVKAIPVSQRTAITH